MTNEITKKYKARSGSELVTTPVPDIPYRIQGLLRANGGRMSLTGQWKCEKSLLAQELAMRLAKGDDWLGFKTIASNLLYINLEISEEKVQERTQDFFAALGYQLGNLARFRIVTILDTNIALDRGTNILQERLDESRVAGSPVDVVILDPRARAVLNSENDEITIKFFCQSVDLILRNNPGLSIIIVTHMGKDPTKGAIGHSRYQGWLDTNIDIVKNERLQCNKLLRINGRDTEKMELGLDFNYPLHKVTLIEVQVRKQKVHEAANFLISQLAAGEMQEQELRRLARTAGHSDYAIWTALRESKGGGVIESIQSNGPGNRKVLRLIPKASSP